MKTNLLFFTKGGPTERTWYFDLSDVKVTKKQPLTLDRFGELFAHLPSRADSPRSWTVSRAEMEARGHEVDAAVARLRALLEAEPGPTASVTG